jgi:hypothetical protein
MDHKMPKLLAEAVELGPGESLKGIGPLAEPGSKEGAINLFNRVISNVIGFLTVVAGLWFVFQFVLGAIGWLSAGGDKVKTENAQKKLTQGVVGLVIVVAAVFLVDLVGGLLGLDILSPGDVILKFWQ